MNRTRDPALAGQRAGGGGEGSGVVPLAVGPGTHERVLVLRAVGGGGQRVPGEGGHHGSAPIGEGRRSGGGGNRAVVAGFLLQELLFGRPRRRQLQQAGGLQHGDATLPAARVLTVSSGGGRGGLATVLIWG